MHANIDPPESLAASRYLWLRDCRFCRTGDGRGDSLGRDSVLRLWLGCGRVVARSIIDQQFPNSSMDTLNLSMGRTVGAGRKPDVVRRLLWIRLAFNWKANSGAAGFFAVRLAYFQYSVLEIS